MKMTTQCWQNDIINDKQDFVWVSFSQIRLTFTFTDESRVKTQNTTNRKEKPKNKPRRTADARDPALTNEDARLVDDVAAVIDIYLIHWQKLSSGYSCMLSDTLLIEVVWLIVCIYGRDVLGVMFELRCFLEADKRVGFRCGRGHVMSVSQSHSSMRLWWYKSDCSRGAITWPCKWNC